MQIRISGTELSLSDRLCQRWRKLTREMNRAIKERMKRYLENTSMNCYHYLINETLSWRSRFIWNIIHLAAVCIVGFMISVAMEVYVTSPTLTTRMPIDAPISRIPFPGIAICSVNRMSRKKVSEFARELISKGLTDMDEHELVNLLGFMGLAYEFEETINGELDTIHDLLTPYNLDNLMKRLSPSCEDLLIQCMWRGNIEDCSKIFSFHKTSEGYCCTFNYIRDSDDFIKNQNVTKNRTGYGSFVKNGLTVLLDPMLEDYLYTRMPNIGFKIMIFNPTDFPDVPSGGCLEQMVMPNNDQYIILDATLVTATEDVEDLPQIKRACYIPSDNRLYDSYSDCVVSCRIKSVLNSCGCIPFLWPSNNMSEPCDLTKNGCLKKWRRLWEDAWSGEDQALESGEEPTVFERGPPCAYCVPACSDTSYRTRRYSVPLNAIELSSRVNGDVFHDRDDIVHKDHSVLNIFFDKDSFIHLSHDIFLTWYEWMGILGGLCGLIMGCSILTVAEFLYFLVLGGPPNEEEEFSPEDEFINESEEEIIENHLYWNEFNKQNHQTNY